MLTNSLPLQRGSMQYRNLGHSGLQVSAIGIGTNQFGGKVSQADVLKILDTLADLGVNFLDTANMYQAGRSETAIGKALKGKRQQWIVATKFFHEVDPGGPNDRGASRKHIFQAVESSLARLQTEFIDLYQIHRWDPETPLEETMSALDDLVRSGKVRYIGASNFTAWQLSEANAIARENGWARLISIQPHYHLFQREIDQELIPAAQYNNIGILPYFPLAGGFLTGKYLADKAAPKGSRGEESPYVQKYFTTKNYAKLEKLGQFAQDHGRTINALAHAWLLAQPQISSVISGATSPEQASQNAASHDWQLNSEDLAVINQILDN